MIGQFHQLLRHSVFCARLLRRPAFVKRLAGIVDYKSYDVYTIIMNENHCIPVYDLNINKGSLAVSLLPFCIIIGKPSKTVQSKDIASPSKLINNSQTWQLLIQSHRSSTSTFPP